MTSCPFVTHRAGVCWCGTKLEGKQRKFCSRVCARRVSSEHRWTNAKAAIKKLAARYECASCGGVFVEVEINHIVPCKGKHSQWGCWHHSDNLEVLCVGCHKTKTDEQRSNGWT